MISTLFPTNTCQTIVNCLCRLTPFRRFFSPPAGENPPIPAPQDPAARGGRLRERRRHVRQNLTAKHQFTQAACCGGLGTVLDISMGGLAVLTDNEAGGSLGVRELDLFFANDLLCIRGVPCRLVSFHESPPEGDASGRRFFRGSYQFLALTEAQSTQIRFAICLNASDEIEWPRHHFPPDLA